MYGERTGGVSLERGGAFDQAHRHVQAPDIRRFAVTMIVGVAFPGPDHVASPQAPIVIRTPMRLAVRRGVRRHRKGERATGGGR